MRREESLFYIIMAPWLWTCWVSQMWQNSPLYDLYSSLPFHFQRTVDVTQRENTKWIGKHLK